MAHPAMHADFLRLLNRLHLPLRQEAWQIGESVEFWEGWRWDPPFAFITEWLGGDLTPNQVAWFHANYAFGQIKQNPYRRTDGTEFSRRDLIVYDQTPLSKPSELYHATPSYRLGAIRREGLKPGHLTGVSTTGFPDSKRWIHLFRSVDHATDRWLLLKDNATRIPSGEYTVLKVNSGWTGDLCGDPYAPHGYVTAAEVIP